MSVISFCTGYGGLELGIRRTGVDIRTVCNVEIEAFVKTDRRLKKGGWITPLSTRILKPSLHQSFEEKYTEFVGVTLVSPSVVREDPRHSREKTQDTYGHISESTSGQLDLFGASSKSENGVMASLVRFGRRWLPNGGACSARRKPRLTNASDASSMETTRHPKPIRWRSIQLSILCRKTETRSFGRCIKNLLRNLSAKSLKS